MMVSFATNSARLQLERGPYEEGPKLLSHPADPPIPMIGHDACLIGYGSAELVTWFFVRFRMMTRHL